MRVRVDDDVITRLTVRVDRRFVGGPHAAVLYIAVFSSGALLFMPTWKGSRRFLPTEDAAQWLRGDGALRIGDERIVDGASFPVEEAVQ